MEDSMFTTEAEAPAISSSGGGMNTKLDAEEDIVGKTVREGVLEGRSEASTGRERDSEGWSTSSFPRQEAAVGIKKNLTGSWPRARGRKHSRRPETGLRGARLGSFADGGTVRCSVVQPALGSPI